MLFCYTSRRLVTETDVVLYCDFHGHSRKNNVFMYGCNTPGDAALKLRERVFPLMMSKNASDKVNCLTHASKKNNNNNKSVGWTTSLHRCHHMQHQCRSIFLSSPSRAVSSGCRRAKREQDGSPCGNLASKTATPWRPVSEAPLWVSLHLCKDILCIAPLHVFCSQLSVYQVTGKERILPLET